jgi:hypothetical protein
VTASPPPELDALNAELLPLLDTVREAVAEQLFGPARTAVNRFLSDAPVGVCVRLFAVWEAARDSGLPLDQFLDRLTPENRFILDLVSAIYSVPDKTDCPALFPDYRELESLTEPSHDQT